MRRGSRTGASPSRILANPAFLAAALLFAAIIATIGRPLIGLGSLHAADTLQSLDPWAQGAAENFAPDNGTVSDTVDAIAPARLQIARRGRAGDLALWTSTQAGGAPALGVPNSAMFSPLNLPWWLAPGHAAPALVKLLQMLVGAVGMVLFSRQLGLSRVAGLVGALAFVNAGHLVVWTTWSQSNIAALVPLLLWALERGLRGERLGDWWAVPLVSATMWFEGFPALTLWAHVLAGSWVLARVAADRRRPAGAAAAAGNLQVRTVVAAAGAMAAGLAIAAVQVVPFLLRVQELSLDAARDTKAAAALPWEALSTVLVSRALGASGSGVWFGPRNEVEIQAFLGVGAMVLVVAAWVWGRRTLSLTPGWWTWSAGAFTVLGAMIFVPFVNTIVQATPVIGGNQSGRLRGLLSFLLAVSVAVGFEAIRSSGAARAQDEAAEHGPSRPRWWRLPVGVTVVVAAFAPTLLAARALASNVGREAFFDDALVLPIVLLATAAALAVVASRGHRPWHVIALALLPVLIAIETVSFARGFLPRIDTDDFYPRTAAHDVVADLVDTNRFAAGGLALYPGTTTLYGLRSVTAHAGMPAAWRALIVDVDDGVLTGNVTFPILAPTQDVAASPTLDLLGVTHFVTAEDVPLFGDRDAAVSDGDDVSHGAQINGVEVQRAVLDLLADHDLPASLAVRLLGPDGLPVAHGERRVNGRETGPWLSVAIAAIDGNPRPTGGRLQVFLRLDPVVDGAAGLRAGIPIPAPTGTQAQVVRAGSDGLAVVAVPDVVIYERPAARQRIRLENAGGDVTAGTLEVLYDRDDELQVRVRGDAVATLVIADAFSGGHRASVDGMLVPVATVHDALIGVQLGPGEHVVRVWFEPEGFRFGATLTVMALLATFAAAFSRRRRRAPRGQ
ncbi:MAG: hypothetical protein ACI867_000523 [Glaciecola sp.]|jgi:hypothetical protein